MKPNLPQVAIVGRANVGKSTLFNRLIEKNKAIVSAVAGTTRDINMNTCAWQSRDFMLVDTGGLDISDRKAGKIEKDILKMAKKAIDNADVIVFLIDIKVGLTNEDKKLAKEILKNKGKKKIILAANKADRPRSAAEMADLYKLGMGEPHAMSAVTGAGTGDLLDVVVENLPKEKKSKAKDADEEPPIKVAIIGQPNVGKSSMINSIMGEERVIVTDIAHTTREAHDMEFRYKDRDFILIDTAGIRRKAKSTKDKLERKSVGKSTHALKEADVILLVTEVQKRLSMQDMKLTQKILENSKSLIIVANKWDLINDKDTKTIDEFVEYYQKTFPYIAWAPLIFISALKDLRTRKVLDMVLDIDLARKTEVSPAQLDRFLKNRIRKHKPSKGKGSIHPYIHEIRQTGINPPRFVIYVNDPAILHFSYIRFLQNGLREKFKIIGTPIQIELKKYKGVASGEQPPQK